MSKDEKLISRHTEFSLLAIIAQNPKLCIEIDEESVTYRDFSNRYYSEIYQTIKDLACNNIAVEQASLINKGQELGFSFSNVAKVKENIHKLFDTSVDYKNIEIYAGKIKSLSFKRQLLKILDQSKIALKDADTATESLEIVENNIHEFVLENIKKDSIVRVTDVIEETLQKFADDPVVGLTTGFETLDDAIGGGIRPGTMTFICGRPGQGKSLLSVHAALQNAIRGYPTLYLDTELGQEMIVTRVTGAWANLGFNRIETAQWMKNENEVERYNNIKRLFPNFPLFYEDAVGKSEQSIISSIRRFVNRHVKFDKNGNYNKSFLVFDYFRLDVDRGNGNEKEYERLGKEVSKLRNVAQQYGISVLCTAQLNKEMFIAGSDRIRHNADAVIYFQEKSRQERMMDDNEGTHKFLIDKVRAGKGIKFNEYIGFKADKSCGFFKDTGIGRLVEDIEDDQ